MSRRIIKHLISTKKIEKYFVFLLQFAIVAYKYNIILVKFALVIYKILNFGKIKYATWPILKKLKNELT